MQAPITVTSISQSAFDQVYKKKPIEVPEKKAASHEQIPREMLRAPPVKKVEKPKTPNVASQKKTRPHAPLPHVNRPSMQAYEGAPTTSVHSQEKTATTGAEGLTISVDPLLVYRHQLIAFIKKNLPEHGVYGSCELQLNLAPDGQMLSVNYNSEQGTGCDGVRHALLKVRRLPGSTDKSVIPYLSDLVMHIEHSPAFR